MEKEIEHLESKYAFDKHFSEKEFNLSKLRKEFCHIFDISKAGRNMLFQDDKEFIKKLREGLDRRLFFDDGSKQYCDFWINKLAGDKLNG